MFQYRSDEPQVKRNLISRIANLVYELPHKLPNNLRLDLWKLRVIRKIPNLGVDIAQRPVSLQEIKFLQSQSKKKKKKAKKGIKLFLPCQILLDFSILFQILFPRFYFFKTCNYKTFAIYIDISLILQSCLQNCVYLLSITPLSTNPLANKTIF